MARIDVHTAKLPSGKIEARIDTRLVADLDEEEAGELATQLLSKLGCSFEIKWPHLAEQDTDRVLAQQRDARERLAEQASIWAMQHAPYHYGDDVRDRLAEAYRAGYLAAPKPVNAVLR